ncbi:mechanosensitive ion channel domain-containing protein [Desulfogranum japonicum]|uniref:mechanosensitive ion channel domain-containing protein n=1 Tax=Desulfogranum japonicum TaxID=231447 RepID=UPI0003FAE6CF|nr:mechanosensitive ion channel domain-containing protein [Desulfogranum japonicum]
MNLISPYLPLLLLTFALGFCLWGLHWFLIRRHKDLKNERKFPRQLLILALSLIAVLALILVLPIQESSRNRLFGLISLVVSGTIAFSSTNLLANLMGGILLRATKPFSIGDFIRVEQHFGRVTERGLFDTEIQTESRELISLPNAYLIKYPISTTRNSGAIVSAKLSLGYDIHHSQVDALLLNAAESSGLKEPWVHVLELGNFAVTYRVSGLLEDSERLITAHSNLCRTVLDTLHGHGVEIMSPTYMNQRRLNENQTTIPKSIVASSLTETNGGEHVVFDKAEEAAKKEKNKQQLTNQIQKLETALKEQENQEEKTIIKRRLESARKRLEALEESENQSDSDNDKELNESNK